MNMQELNMVITVPTDALTPVGARPLAGMTTKPDMIFPNFIGNLIFRNPFRL